jgi:hypothetical protein
MVVCALRVSLLVITSVSAVRNTLTVGMFLAGGQGTHIPSRHSVRGHLLGQRTLPKVIAAMEALGGNSYFREKVL